MQTRLQETMDHLARTSRRWTNLSWRQCSRQPPRCWADWRRRSAITSGRTTVLGAA